MQISTKKVADKLFKLLPSVKRDTSETFTESYVSPRVTRSIILSLSRVVARVNVCAARARAHVSVQRNAESALVSKCNRPRACRCSYFVFPSKTRLTDVRAHLHRERGYSLRRSRLRTRRTLLPPLYLAVSSTSTRQLL